MNTKESYQEINLEFFRQKKKILVRTFFCSSLSIFLLLLIQPPSFVATASFRQITGRNSSSLFLKQLLPEGDFFEKETAIAPFMQSQRVLHYVIGKTGLQMHVQETGIFKRLFKNAYHSLQAELDLFIEEDAHFTFKDVHYEGERKLKLSVYFTSPTHFILSDRQGNKLSSGHIGETIRLPHLSFILETCPDTLTLEKQYPLTVKPWQKVLDKHKKRLSIRPHPLDKNLLLLSYRKSGRSEAAAFLNQIMAAYTHFMNEDIEMVTSEQLNYLKKRERELSLALNDLLDEQASYLKKNMGEEGFIGLSQEIDILTGPKEQWISRLFQMDLDLKKWEKINQDTSLALQNQTREMPLTKDAVTLTCRLNVLDQRMASPPRRMAFKTPQFTEFHGIDLETGEQLYLNYAKEYDALLATQRQLQLTAERLQKSPANVSSLSLLVLDEIGRDAVSRAKELSFQLKDAANHSLKEQERIQAQLLIHEKFLQDHIPHLIEVNHLKEGMTLEKMHALQRMIIDLTKREKTLIQEKLGDIRRRMADLPDKWRLENQLKMKMELMKTIIEKIAELGESKQSELHMHQIASKPLDLAVPPLDPVRPYIALYSLVTGVLGALLRVFYLLYRKTISFI